MLTFSRWKIILSTGLALFAMFFGAGNIIFPLKVGSISGEYISLATIAFIISGVGVPFLGVFAISLYEGNYWKFFNRIGKSLSFVLVTFLILTIGLLFAGPRTEVITYSTLFPILPGFLQNPYVFSIAYFSIIFLAIYKQSHVVDIIGWFFSPIKIFSFLLLIIVGMYTASPFIDTPLTAGQAFHSSLITGYGTMDLLAAFFFCSVAYKNVVNKSGAIGITSHTSIIRMMLIACIIGAGLISLVYTGLIYLAGSHAEALQHVPTEALIVEISNIVLGKNGSMFVGFCVLIACLATGATLAEVSTEYFHQTVFKEKLPRLLCLIMVLCVMFMMSILGFEGIMKIASPILNILYPILIGLCIVNIAFKMLPRKKVTAESLPLS